MTNQPLGVLLHHLRRAAARRHDDELPDGQLLERFAQQRDEAAFAALLRRHGPMVLSVCRGILRNGHDVEDAFQATFLVLAQKAASIRRGQAVGGWLHEVAYHIAIKAQALTARRQRCERRMPDLIESDPLGDLTVRELRQALHEELRQLPEKYRAPLILCYLEGQTQEEAARQLGWPKRRLKDRLQRGREQLRRRLSQRGLAPMAALGTALFAVEGVSAPLASATVRSAMQAVPLAPTVAALAEAAGAMLSLSKTKATTMIVLVVTLLAVAASGSLMGLSRLTKEPLAAAPQPAVARADDKPPSATPQREPAKTVELRGRVLDPDGKPVRGAKLLFLYQSTKEIPPEIWAASDADGRFRFSVPVAQVGSRYWEKPWEDTYVLAAAEGYGFAVARLGKPASADLTLRLVQDDVPLRGRILDLQGKPVPGVRVRIYYSLYAPEKGDLTPWLTTFQDPHRDPHLTWSAPLTSLFSPAYEVLFPPVTTGADGRFCLKGIGRERVAELHIEGPTIATQTIHAMTRLHETIRLPEDPQHPKKGTIAYYGANFDLVAAPTRPIVGVVRDKDTGQPLPGITIETEKIAHRFGLGFLRTTTDKDGRYRLVGLPKGAGNTIAATTNDLPYLAAVKLVANPLGLDPITIDFALKRGVWVKGRVTDKTTGKPLAAEVEYFCFEDNPNAGIVRGLFYYSRRETQEDGSYRIPALPGRGLIAARAYGDHYPMGVGGDKIEDPNPERTSGIFSTIPYGCAAGNYHALVEISPKSDEKSITCNVTLDPGRSLKGTVLDPEGKPLAGARVAGLKDMGYWLNTGAEFTVESLQPNKRRVLRFVHEGKKLASYLVLRGDEKAPLTVRLQPWGTLTGRLVTPQGEPVAGANVSCGALYVQTRKDGRFRIEGLADGVKYGLSITKDAYVQEIIGGDPKDLTVQAGETRDLGVLKIKEKE